MEPRVESGMEKSSKGNPVMKAKCPRCKSGCLHCKDGFIEVKLPGLDSSAHRRKCDACGKTNGARYTGPDLPPLRPVPTPGPCVWCGSENTRWDPPPPPGQEDETVVPPGWAYYNGTSPVELAAALWTAGGGDSLHPPTEDCKALAQVMCHFPSGRVQGPAWTLSVEWVRTPAGGVMLWVGRNREGKT